MYITKQKFTSLELNTFQPTDLLHKKILDFCFEGECIYNNPNNPLQCKLVTDTRSQEPIDFCPLIKFLGWRGKDERRDQKEIIRLHQLILAHLEGLPTTIVNSKDSNRSEYLRGWMRALRWVMDQEDSPTEFLEEEL